MLSLKRDTEEGNEAGALFSIPDSRFTTKSDDKSFPLGIYFQS